MSLKLNGGTGIEFTSNTQFVDNAQLKFKTTSQTFTVKGIDAAITDSQTSTAPDTSDSDSGQLAIYNGATKLWGITEHGYVVNSKVPYFHADKNNTDSQTTTGEIAWNNTCLLYTSPSPRD